MLLKEQLSSAIKSRASVKVSSVLEKIDWEMVNGKNEKGKSALHEAFDCGNQDAVILLLAKPGIDVTVEDESGRTPLHRACSGDNDKAVAMLLACPGVNVNAKNKFGKTAVMLAAGGCRVEALDLMLKDERVQIDRIDHDGSGLEEWVGKWAPGRGRHKIKKEICRQMIMKERKKRFQRRYLELFSGIEKCKLNYE